jgi:NAD(P)H-nitrite reductase large subunit
MKFKEFITEQQHEDRVCACNNISRGNLLKQSSFSQNNTIKEVLNLMVKTGCGCCLKSLNDWKKSACTKKKELQVHFSEI